MNIKTLFIVSLLFVFVLHAFPQEKIEMKKSEEIVLIGGYKYYVHIVEPGHTLFSIAKLYGVKQEIIISANPFLIEGLKIGQVLKIPAGEVYEKVELKESDKYIYHILKEGETLYSLSKMYNTPLQDIVKENPELEVSALQINQVVKIPKNKGKDSTELVVNEDINFIYHEVQKKETLYSLSRYYNVTVVEIKAVNEGLEENGLKAGQLIKIPKGINSIDSLSIQDTVLVDSTLLDSMMIHLVNCDTFSYPRNSPLNVALMLPFCTSSLEENLSIYSDTTKTEERDSRYAVSLSSVDFYQGFLLALQEFKASGIDVNLYTYDTERSTDVSKKLILKPELKKMDLIIGPAYAHNFDVVSEFARENKIPIVTPLSSKDSALRNNNMVFQVNPSDITEAVGVVKFFTDTFPDKHFIVIYTENIADYDLAMAYKNAIARLDSSVRDSLFSQCVFNDTIDKHLKRILKTDRENIFLIISDREAVVGQIISKVQQYILEYHVGLFGLPAWVYFRNIDLEYYYNFTMFFYSPFYIDFEKKEINQFIANYRKQYYTDIYKVTSEGYTYSMMGYDIGKYFLNAINTYGVDFRYCIQHFSMPLLQGDFKFHRISAKGGWENSKLHFMQFTRDLTLESFTRQLYNTQSEIRKSEMRINR